MGIFQKTQKIIKYYYIIKSMINYLDKLPPHNFYLKLYFTPLKMNIPIPLKYVIESCQKVFSTCWQGHWFTLTRHDH